MRLAQAIRQPALLRSEAVLLPALPTENVRAALSQVRSKDRNIQVDPKSFRPVEPAVAVSVRAGRQMPELQPTGSMAGRAVLRQVGAPYGSTAPNVRQNVHFSGPYMNTVPTSKQALATAVAAGTGAVPV